jgi:hypothetical protein
VIAKALEFDDSDRADYDLGYTLTVTASDGAKSANVDVSVSVTEINEFAPVFGISARPNAPSQGRCEGWCSTHKNQKGVETTWEARCGLDTNACVACPECTIALKEDASKGTIVTMTATDKDRNAKALTFKLVSTGVPFRFTDATTGKLDLTEALDREGGTPDKYVLDVQVIDNSPDRALWADTKVTVTIADLNEHAPVFGSTSYAVSIEENGSVGDSVAKTTATDADATAPAMVYSLANGGEIFKLKSTASGEIVLAKTIDFDDANRKSYALKYDLVVTATDGEKKQTAAVTVTVTDVNEFDPVFGDTSITVALTEAATKGTVLTLTATDKDVNENALSFKLLTKNVPFAIADALAANCC